MNLNIIRFDSFLVADIGLSTLVSVFDTNVYFQRNMFLLEGRLSKIVFLCVQACICVQLVFMCTCCLCTGCLYVSYIQIADDTQEVDVMVSDDVDDISQTTTFRPPKLREAFGRSPLFTDISSGPRRQRVFSSSESESDPLNQGLNLSLHSDGSIDSGAITFMTGQFKPDRLL